MYKRHDVPNYEEASKAIQNLSNEALREYVNDDEKVGKLIKDVNQLKELETDKEMFMAQNKSLAEYNLSLQPKLESGKTKLKELSTQVQALCDTIQEKQNELKKHSGNLSSDTALALLQAAAAEAEDESEKITEKFYHKEIEIEDFLELLKEARKKMHLRRVKADKMSDILSKKKVAGNQSHVQRPAPPVPYPVGNSYMPLYPSPK